MRKKIIKQFSNRNKMCKWLENPNDKSPPLGNLNFDGASFDWSL